MNIIIIIAVIVVAVLLAALLARKISNDYAKDRAFISERGGMRKVYSTFINGILEYPSAEVVSAADSSDAANSLTIQGVFTGIEDGAKHGEWTLTLKHTFNIVQMDYNSKVYFNDVIQGEKHWEFPIDNDQHAMLTTVKEKMDSTTSHGVHL